MLGLDEQELSLSFEVTFPQCADEVVGFHQAEFPIAAKALKRIQKYTEELNLSLNEFHAASCLTILKVIEMNNLAIERQLRKVGFSL